MKNNWITVASFSRPVEAHLARTQLEADGITCVVSDEYLVRVDWLLSNAVGGVKLMVPVGEAERARDILRPRPHLVVVAGAGSEEEMICPRCHCDDVYYTRFDRRAQALFILLLGFMIPWRSRRWMCKQCGYSWKEH
jgi:Putative prokaryotic signal transducing protein